MMDHIQLIGKIFVENMMTSLSMWLHLIQKDPNSKLKSGSIYQNESCILLISWTRYSWWRHQMETFSALLDLCAGNSPVTGEFPLQRPVTRIFDVFFDFCLNKRLSKQSWDWWLETPSCSLWRHCNVKGKPGFLVKINVINVHLKFSRSTANQ